MTAGVSQLHKEPGVKGHLQGDRNRKGSLPWIPNSGSSWKDLERDVVKEEGRSGVGKEEEEGHTFHDYRNNR